MSQLAQAHPVTAYRQLKGWSTNDLARAAGISQSTIVRIENGDIKQPRVSAVMALAKAMDLKDLARLLEPWARSS